MKEPEEKPIKKRKVIENVIVRKGKEIKVHKLAGHNGDKDDLNYTVRKEDR